MKTLLHDIAISLRATIALGIIVCGLYPVVVWLVAQGVFPYQANGSLIVVQGTKTGSAIIGQKFVGEKYFHPRPSAAGEGYDAADSGGANLGPLSGELVQTVAERIARYRRENGLSDGTLVPADAVTASASGLDPHISPANAELQGARVARARGLPEESVRQVIAGHTEGRVFGIFGEPRVNILALNLALDKTNTNVRTNK